MNRRCQFATALGLALALQASIAFAEAVVDPEVNAAVAAAATPATRIKVIIELTASRSAIRELRATGKVPRQRRLIGKSLRDLDGPRRAVLRQQVEGEGGNRVRDLWIARAISADVPARAIARLARRPQVARIRLDTPVVGPTPQLAPSSPSEWNVDKLGAPSLWQLGYDGTGMVVGILDSGVDPGHADLASRWRSGAGGWFDPFGEHTSPADISGHGTSVASVILGGDATGSSIGVAPGARWIAGRIFDDNGVGTLSSIHLGFQWLLDPDLNPATDDAPSIVNNSWSLLGSEGTCVTEFIDDIETLRSAGIVPVFAAGNTGPSLGSDVSPANNPGAIAVAASDRNDAVAGFSGRGPSSCGGEHYPSITAPGIDIKAADLSFGGVIPDAYTYLNGTSFATPHVSGALAILRQAFPELGVDEATALLTGSATDLGATGPDSSYGFGRIDVRAAFDLAIAQGHTPTPIVDPNDQDGDGYLVAQDCNDRDAAVHPGATDIVLDGIDQDCNGYDLSIVVSSVTYNAKRGKLSVRATSALGKAAKLVLVGYGPMKYAKALGEWKLNLTGVKPAPSSLEVSGVEGSTTWTPGS